MKSIPTVSIMISTYNRADYLRKSTESVLSQTFTDFELILCDDASTDTTASLCKEFMQQDDRVRVLRHEQNSGMVNNWNSGLNASQGLYFAKLDDDNVYLPTFIEKTMSAFESLPGTGFVFSDEWRIDTNGVRNIRATEIASAHYRRANMITGTCKNIDWLAVQQAPSINATLFNREVLIHAGGFRKLAGNFADFDVFLNLSSKGCKAAYIAERLVEYRQHGDQDGHSYLRSIEKAQSSIAILESVSFSGEAEQARKQKLSQAYATLSRTLLLNSDVVGARKALAVALRIQPTNLRLRALELALHLPSSLVRFGMDRRYTS